MCKKTLGTTLFFVVCTSPFLKIGGEGGENILSCVLWGAAANEFQFFSFLTFSLKNINLKIKRFLHTLSIIQSIIICIYQNCLYMHSISPFHYTFFWGITVSPKF